MSRASIGSPRAPAAIILAAGPTIAAAAIRPAAAGAPIPSVPTVRAIDKAAPAIIAIIPTASTQKSGSFIARTKSSPNCLKSRSALRAISSKAAFAASPIFLNPSLILLPTSSRTRFMSSPNLRNASATPFFSGSKARASAPSLENKSVSPLVTSLNSSSKFTRPLISFERIG